MSAAPAVGGTPAVVCEHLGVRFGDFEALRDVTVTIPDGAVLAILGPNGSGKSTFLKVVLGLTAPSAGRVSVFGTPPSAVPPGWIGYVPQVKTLDRTFPALALELVGNGLRRGWPGRLTEDERRRAGEALAEVGAQHLADRPLGRLSGGELQRVYLARGLVRRPKLVVLDEPASGIDAAGEADMYRLLDAYHRASGAAMLMVTHDWEAAYHHATHVLVLSGRLVAFGPPSEVLTDNVMRRAFGHVDHDHAMHVHEHVHDEDVTCDHGHGAAAHDERPREGDGAHHA